MDHGVSPTLRLWQLAESLRGHRERCDLTIEEAANKLKKHSARWSRSKVQRIETRNYSPKPPEVEQMAKAYDITGDDADELVQMAAEARQRGWWQRSAVPKEGQTMIGLEQAAKTVRQFDLGLIPGLLQTSDYARALMATIEPSTPADVLEHRAAARMVRQQVLTRDNPLELQVVLTEAVLRTPVGSSRVMRGQLESLLETTSRPNIIIQILPFAAGAHPGLEGAFTLLTLPHLASDVGYVEGIAGYVYLESQDDIRRCTMRWATLSALAMQPAPSMELISTILEMYR